MTPAAAMSSNSSSDSMWSVIYVILGIPGSWRFWYRSIYVAARDSRSTAWCFFFINFCIHLALMCCLAVAVPSMAGSGLMLMLKMFSGGYNGLGVACLISCIIFSLDFFMSLYCFKVARKIWKNQGGMEQMKADATRSVVSAGMEMKGLGGTGAESKV